MSFAGRPIIPPSLAKEAERSWSGLAEAQRTQLGEITSPTFSAVRLSRGLCIAPSEFGLRLGEVFIPVSAFHDVRF